VGPPARTEKGEAEDRDGRVKPASWTTATALERAPALLLSGKGHYYNL
jgi:hypothetical protein